MAPASQQQERGEQHFGLTPWATQLRFSPMYLQERLGSGLPFQMATCSAQFGGLVLEEGEGKESRSADS